MHRPVEVLGRFVQVLPNNWKLYVENVKDTYHASLLHAFFGTFRITRLTQGGGVAREPRRRRTTRATPSTAPTTATSTAYRDQGIRSEKSSYRLADPSLLDTVDEFGDGIKLQILSVFPNLVVQQIYNCLAVRQVAAQGAGRDGAALDVYRLRRRRSPEMRRRRLRQANLVGPAGYVSMEDGCVGGFVQRGAAAAGGRGLGGQHGRRGRGVPGDARHRGLGARLLEGVPALHG